MNRLSSVILTLIAMAACGTTNVHVEPVKVEPIHMTVDINLHDNLQDTGKGLTPKR